MLPSACFYILSVGAAICVANKLPAPRDLKVTSSTPTTQTLSWNSPRTTSDVISFYVIQGRSNFDVTWYPMTTTPSNITSSPCTVVHLLPNNIYRYKMAAVSSRGRGLWSKKTPRITTPSAAPVIAPTNVTARVMASGVIKISWLPLGSKYLGSSASDVSYTVAIKNTFLSSQNSSNSSNSIQSSDDDREMWLEKIVRGHNSSSTEFKVETKSDQYLYFVKVQAQNHKGKGPFSTPICIHSSLKVPTAIPSGFRVDWTEAYRAGLSWDAVNDSNGEIKQYKVCLCNLIIGCEWQWLQNFTTESSEPTVVLTGMKPNNIYMAKFAVVISAGSGPWSADGWDSMDPGILIFNTARPPPSFPPEEVHFVVEGQMLTAYWKPIKVFTTRVLGYSIEYWRHNETNKEATKEMTANTIISIKLLPDTDYYIWVRGFNRGGPGKPTRVYEVSTIPGKNSEMKRGDGGGTNSIENNSCLIAILIFAAILQQSLWW